MKQLTTTNYGALTHETYDFTELVLKGRFTRALEEGASRYPIFRHQRFAARVELEALLDAIALDPVWTCERLDWSTMILDGDGVFISLRGARKADYCSVAFGVWASDVRRAEKAREQIVAKAGATRISEPMFSIEWHFLTSRGELESASIEEMADDVIHDLAYPEIAGGVRAFIQRFLDARETVLVLQGPPGTGKTRLIRAILGEISRRKGGEAQALYTGDMKALESDQIFVKFITGRDDAFVVEDADHLLKPRAEGNEHLHRFLTIADGVVRAQGRKIIFSTNLPNVGDLDDALIRPGRCFARIHARALTAPEARALVEHVAAGDAEAVKGALPVIAQETKSYTLAEVYQALG